MMVVMIGECQDQAKLMTAFALLHSVLGWPLAQLCCCVLEAKPKFTSFGCFAAQSTLTASSLRPFGSVLHTALPFTTFESFVMCTLLFLTLANYLGVARNGRLSSTRKSHLAGFFSDRGNRTTLCLAKPRTFATVERTDGAPPCPLSPRTDSLTDSIQHWPDSRLSEILASLPSFPPFTSLPTIHSAIPAFHRRSLSLLITD